jgi:hypothetical protein
MSIYKSFAFILLPQIASPTAAAAARLLPLRLPRDGVLLLFGLTLSMQSSVVAQRR